MTEWGVVTVIIALGGFVLAIVAPVIKLNTTITRLTTIVDRLQSRRTMRASKTRKVTAACGSTMPRRTSS